MKSVGGFASAAFHPRPSPPTLSMLTDAHIEQYRTDGYVLVADLLESDTLDMNQRNLETRYFAYLGDSSEKKVRN